MFYTGKQILIKKRGDFKNIKNVIIEILEESHFLDPSRGEKAVVLKNENFCHNLTADINKRDLK